MVAILSPGRSLKDSFYYNENKVRRGEAVLILAENYPRKTGELSGVDRLFMLQKMAALRPNVKVNSLHISLNFDPSEHLSEQQLSQIAREYMEQIGFGNQPYLVYQHFDAAHPHIHLLTTNIQADSSRIGLHHLGILASEPARKMIEQKYGLVQAELQTKADYSLKPVSLQKAVYGRSQTRRGIANVLSGVLEGYKFSSLAELNALLSLYNVRADRGNEGSRIYQHRGLVYRLIDTQGKPVGVPLKASLFAQKPGLDYLEKRFASGEVLKIPFKSRLKNAIDLALWKDGPGSVPALAEVLKKQGIDLVSRSGAGGQIYGLTYIDHQTRCVFNGSQLGKSYSAKSVQQRLLKAQSGLPVFRLKDEGIAAGSRGAGVQSAGSNYPDADFSKQLPGAGQVLSGPGEKGVVDLLFEPEQARQPDPYDLTRRRKKRKHKPKINTQ